MKKNFFIILFILSLVFQNSQAGIPYFVDFKFILNQSIAGKKAQQELKRMLNDGIQKIEKKQKNVLEEEKKIVQQKKLINPEEYKKKVEQLREKVSSLQKERNSLLEDISKKRKKARESLLKTLNPILEQYMKENNIRMIVDKKSILLADENLNLTDKIIKILNQKIKSVSLN